MIYSQKKFQKSTNINKPKIINERICYRMCELSEGDKFIYHNIDRLIYKIDHKTIFYTLTDRPGTSNQTMGKNSQEYVEIIKKI